MGAAAGSRGLRARTALWLAGAALAASSWAHAAVVVPVEVDLRAEIAAGRFDPARDGVGVRGGQPPLSWEHSLPARPLGDGRYGLELRFERPPFGGQPVPYKFRIERAGQVPGEGWEAGPNHPLYLDRPSPRIARAFGAPAETVLPRRTGTIERLGVVASAHVTPRAVQVWLPPGYAASDTSRHPVLYLQDGQNVFDGRAAVGEWMADETAQRLVEAGAIEPPILVAVDSGAQRVDDYTPTAMAWAGQRIGGGAAAYARFLAEELKPLIDRRYRTRPEPVHTAVGGSSMGGLLTLWLALHRGEVFGSALVVSPAVWWDDFHAVRDVLALAPAPAPRPRLWLDIGLREGDEALAGARQLRQALMARGWTAETLAYAEVPGASHDEISWAARFEGMLRFLYARPAAASR
jgi:predicted alpha/beta superfamily hydrolase